MLPWHLKERKLKQLGHCSAIFASILSNVTFVAFLGIDTFCVLSEACSGTTFSVLLYVPSIKIYFIILFLYLFF